MFTKILIANRGEIARRIIQTCKRIGIRTVAVYSEVDARSLHVREADESIFIGPSRSDQSYLVKEKIIKAARESEAEAVHPGYGFLSENAVFAEMVVQSGLTFIGPPAQAIARMGDKVAAKEMAARAGVPVIPGVMKSFDQMNEAMDAADRIGYPLFLKPVAGGGGKGMRIVNTREEFATAMKIARDETRKSFGDDRIFVERYISMARHIEMQILADHQGGVVHLGERECSIQRRHQKVIEETPSVAVDEDMRSMIGEYACRLAREAGYVNAGTVEFVLDETGNFYFLEMNTRLQVEHPVTEMLTGLDLVELQIRIAAGEPLPFVQEEVIRTGWAIEARVCAEDPARGFAPSTGMITRYYAPEGKNIRLDSGIEAGSNVSVFYDSLLAKVIAWGETRTSAIYTLGYALNSYHIEGVISNVDFINSVLNHPEFIAGRLCTGFIDTHFTKGLSNIDPPMERLHLMAAAATLTHHNRQALVRESLKHMVSRVGVSHGLNNSTIYQIRSGNDLFEIHLEKNNSFRNWTLIINGSSYNVITPEFEFYRRRLKLKIDGIDRMFRLYYYENFIGVAFFGANRIFEIFSPAEWRLARHMPVVKNEEYKNVLRCPMPGLVVEVNVSKGDRVFKGQDLVCIESMKMQSFVASPCDGIVEEVLTTHSQAVETGEILIKFKL